MLFSKKQKEAHMRKMLMNTTFQIDDRTVTKDQLMDMVKSTVGNSQAIKMAGSQQGKILKPGTPAYKLAEQQIKRGTRNQKTPKGW
jgi:hypothetical protein